MDHSAHQTGHGGHDMHGVHGSTSLTTGGSPGMSHGSAGGFLKRFWIVTVLLIPLVISSEGLMGFFGLPALTIAPVLKFVIATIIFYFGLIFFQHARHELEMAKPGMMTLVSLAVGSGYLFSAVATFVPALDVSFYLEISTLIWVLLFGHYLEAKSSSAAGDALSAVEKLLPQTAHLLRGKEVEDISVSELREGDVVLVKPGEKVPADGVIIKGSSDVDQSHISGESKPIAKIVDGDVVAGSVVLNGSLTIRLSRVGENSTVGQIKKLIAAAAETKPTSQRIADKASLVLTVVALSTAIIAMLVWSLLLGETFVFSITLAITVLVIACPHALGLAIPTVTTISTSLALKNGIFIKDLSKIETIRKTDYVIFDKTGTLTEGDFGVSDVRAIGKHEENEVLRIAASLEQDSSHVIGYSILKYAKVKGVGTGEITDFKNVAGKGVRAKLNGLTYMVGNRAMVTKEGPLSDVAEDAYVELARGGKTVIFVAGKEGVIGLLALSDTIKEESRAVIKLLHKLGVKVAMQTGDSDVVASAVAKELGIDDFNSEVLPEDKYLYVKELQEKGNVVLMVGDGVNDAPALAQADAGVAIGAGTDIAIEAGDVVLTESNPRDVAKLIVLSRAVYRKMIQNLVWAFGYNVIAIPAAAGVFAGLGFILRPEIGALVMSLSTVIVVANALTLKGLKL